MKRSSATPLTPSEHLRTFLHISEANANKRYENSPR